MPPADHGPSESGEDEPSAPAPAGRGPTKHVRCEHCLDVLWTRHPWDSATCSCGELSLTGSPWSPTVRWATAPGGGWSELDPVAAHEPDESEEQLPPTRIGYRR